MVFWFCLKGVPQGASHMTVLLVLPPAPPGGKTVATDFVVAYEIVTGRMV